MNSEQFLPFAKGGEGEFVLVDEPLDPVHSVSSDNKPHDNAVIGTGM